MSGAVAAPGPRIGLDVDLSHGIEEWASGSTAGSPRNLGAPKHQKIVWKETTSPRKPKPPVSLGGIFAAIRAILSRWFGW
ncbi:hypothetical protein [Micromonospora sp. NPDC005237]|uniref:hypothetical protein n=1 Tax=Micromonospora sp. NPDC005237 TaxID=3155113 RepID=UPI0033AD3BFB